jgi:hypothetical protein
MKENLKKGVQRKGKKIINMLADHLTIRHKKTKIEYTIQKIVIEDSKLVIIAYRYYSKPESNKKVFVNIIESEFNQYEPV